MGKWKRQISMLCVLMLLFGSMTGNVCRVAQAADKVSVADNMSCWWIPESFDLAKGKEAVDLSTCYSYDAAGDTYTRDNNVGWQNYNVAFLYTEQTYNDFTLEFDVTFCEPVNQNSWVWILFGSKDPADTLNADLENGASLAKLIYETGDNGKVISENWGNNHTGWWGNWVTGIGNDVSQSHHVKVVAKEGKYSVYLDNGVISEGWALPNYTGGYIGIGTGNGTTTFSNISIEASVNMEELFDGYTAYRSTSVNTFYVGDTMQASSFAADWECSADDMIVRKDNGGTAAVYSTESYNDFEMEFDFTTGADDNTIYVGVGAAEAGGAWCEWTSLKDPSPTILRIHDVGVVAYAPTSEGKDGWFGNGSGNLFTTDEAKKAVHKAKITVSDSQVTVYIDGNCQGTITMQNYAGGHIFLGGCTGKVSFSVPEIVSTTITEEFTNAFAGYAAARTEGVYKLAGLTSAELKENWYLDGNHMLHKKGDKGAALYLPDVYGQNIRMTFRYTVTRDDGFCGAFVGFGSGQKGEDWYLGADTATSNILRIHKTGDVGYAPDVSGAGDWWIMGGKKPFASETEYQEVHTAVIELKYDTCYLWIDDVYVGTHPLVNYNGGYIFLGAYNDDVSFSLPTVEQITPTKYGDVDSAAYGKKALFIGDSISEGAGDRAAWAKRLKYHFDLEMKNNSKGGWIIAKGDTELSSIQTQLETEADNSYDYIVVEGGINDIIRNNADTTRCPLGAISQSYELADFDQNTFAGGLESIFYHATTDHKGAKVGYILTYKPSTEWINSDAAWTNAEAYVAAAKAICEKWDIQILNMWDDAELNAQLHASGSGLLTDGLHFSDTGYELVNESIARWFEALTVPRSRVTVTVTAKTVDNAEVSADVTGGNIYKAGETVTVTAPAEDPIGYEFLGWYENDVLCSGERAYTFTAEDDRNLVARYKAAGKGTITVVDGTSQQSYDRTFGQKLTIQAAGTGFINWTNKYGMIVSKAAAYTFTVTADDTLTANYETTEGKTIVVWESDYGQVIQRGEYTAADTITAPTNIPSRIGYTATDWQQTVDQIIAKIGAGEKLITVKPNYTKDTSSAFKITATNGTLNKTDGTYAMNELVIATAEATKDGQTFSCWKNAAGNILGYETVYRFYATQDYSITAVYGETVTPEGTATITQVLRDTAADKLSFVAMLTVPEGCTIEYGGILATADSTKAASGLTRENADYVRGMSYDGAALRYTWTVRDTQADRVWYVCPYVVYRDAEGTLHEIVGGMESETPGGQANAGTADKDETPVR